MFSVGGKSGLQAGQSGTQTFLLQSPAVVIYGEVLHLHMASSWHDNVLTYICGWHGELCSQIMIAGNVPEPIQ